MINPFWCWCDNHFCVVAVVVFRLFNGDALSWVVIMDELFLTLSFVIKVLPVKNPLVPSGIAGIKKTLFSRPLLGERK